MGGSASRPSAIEERWDRVLESWSERNTYKSQQHKDLRDAQIDENDSAHLMNNALTYSVQAPAEITARNRF